jgi:HAD superfamily hydrolase (TIGR01459 family)
LPRLVRGLAELAEAFDLLLCDVWGVLHDGLTAYPAAVLALRRFRAGGGRVVLVTNSPSPSRIVAAQIQSIGITDDAYDAIVSSGDVTAALLVARADATLYPLGAFEGTDLHDEVSRLRGSPPRLGPIEAADLVLCTVYVDPDKESLAEYDTRLVQCLERGLDLVCANPDIVVQHGDKLYYCAGALAERYAAAGGKVLMAGKPYPPIYDAALDLARNSLGRPIDRSRVLVIGDAMRTDIKGAHDQGLASLFVTSGIHRDELHGQVQGGELDAAAYRQFLAGAFFAPTAAIAELVW